MIYADAEHRFTVVRGSSVTSQQRQQTARRDIRTVWRAPVTCSSSNSQASTRMKKKVGSRLFSVYDAPHITDASNISSDFNRTCIHVDLAPFYTKQSTQYILRYSIAVGDALLYMYVTLCVRCCLIVSAFA